MPEQTTAMAYGPDRPSAKPGVRIATDAEVIVLDGPDALNVSNCGLVEVETLPGGRGDWAIPGLRLTVHRHQLDFIRRPGYSPHAMLAARSAMSSLASAMTPNSGPLRRNDPVAYWDLRASMDDQRAALCLANGISLESISRDGYDIGGLGSREYVAAKRAEHGARIG